MRIGAYDVVSIQTGRFALDGGAMFGVVPRVLWQRHITPDEKHRIPMALRSLLIQGEDRIILVDTGVGETKWSEKERSRSPWSAARFAMTPRTSAIRGWVGSSATS